MSGRILAASAALMFLLASCGTSGDGVVAVAGSAGGEDPPSVAVTTVVLSGAYEMPDGGTASIRVDGVEATLAGGRWTCPVGITGPDHVATVTMLVDDVVVSTRLVSVTH